MRLFEQLAQTLVAFRNCVESNNEEWRIRHEAKLHELTKDFMPSGSGVDCGTKILIQESKRDRLVFKLSYHHMNDNGMYDGWTEHLAVVTPSLVGGFNLNITGRNRRGIKEYLHEIYDSALRENIDWDADKERYVRVEAK